MDCQGGTEASAEDPSFPGCWLRPECRRGGNGDENSRSAERRTARASALSGSPRGNLKRLRPRIDPGGSVASNPRFASAPTRNRPVRGSSPPRLGSGAAPSGVLRRPKPPPVSPRAPRQGRSPGGSPLGGSGTLVPVPTLSAFWPKPASRKERDPRAEALGSAWQSMDRSPGSCRVGSAPARRPRFLPDRSLNPKVRCPVLSASPHTRRLPGSPEGASRSMPLSHPLKGKPAASAWRRLRQPPCLHFRLPRCPEGQ
jgi:hypothetical protein